jgi:hypothetical protein
MGVLRLIDRRFVDSSMEPIGRLPALADPVHVDRGPPVEAQEVQSRSRPPEPRDDGHGVLSPGHARS